jgi:hypothetical protein
VQDHDDYDQPFALGQVRISRPGLTDIAVHQLTHDSSESVDAGGGPMRGGDVREGLHEGVRRGVLVGIRPASDPSPGAISPGDGGGGRSTVSADLRGRWS